MFGHSSLGAQEYQPRRDTLDSPNATIVHFSLKTLSSHLQQEGYNVAGVITVRDWAVPVCPTIRDMCQQCSGVCTRQISFIRDHNVSLILQSAVRSHHSPICNYTSGNPHVIKNRPLYCKTPPRGHQRLPTSLRLNLVVDGVKTLCKLVGKWPSWPHSYEAG
jgi:hypothetical protein